MLSEDVVRLTVHSPRIAASARPGQFVMLKTSSVLDPLLRRPFSISQTIDNDCIQIVFKILGKGTKLLAESKIGQPVDIVGPLGKGFRAEGQIPVCLVGGGMGIAPLLFLAREIVENMKSAQLFVFLGARNATELKPFDDDFNRLGLHPFLATDDGSLGHHGLVTELMTAQFSEHSVDFRVVSCGPYPMLKAVATLCRGWQWPCEVSLETIMACGMGACLGCAIPRAEKLGDGYLHVCSDGPVFDAEAVLWR